MQVHPSVPPRPRRMTWINAETVFELRDRGVEVYDEEEREWEGPSIQTEITVMRQVPPPPLANPSVMKGQVCLQVFPLRESTDVG